MTCPRCHATDCPGDNHAARCAMCGHTWSPANRRRNKRRRMATTSTTERTTQ